MRWVAWFFLAFSERVRPRVDAAYCILFALGCIGVCVFLPMIFR